MKKDIVNHLDALNENFERYFDKQPVYSTWFRDPFFANLDNEDDTDLVVELIEIRSKALLKDNFNKLNLANFWYSLIESYPGVAKIAIQYLIPFATTYLCESGFSCLVDIKTKKRNKLNPQHYMRLALSETEPNINLLVNQKQQSHKLFRNYFFTIRF